MRREEKSISGLFIATKRKEMKKSQNKLAQEVFVSRETISKWERGISRPKGEALERLCEVLNVTPEEIKSGKKLETFSENEDNPSKAKRKISKKKLLFPFIIILIIIFLGIYFLNNYNSIKIYTISYAEDDSLVINDGTLIVTKDKIIFDLGNIKSNQNITALELFYTDENNMTVLITKRDSDYIHLYDFYGYNAYFDYDIIEHIANNLYLTIYFGETTKTVKLDLTKYFSNNKLIYFKKIPISEK